MVCNYKNKNKLYKRQLEQMEDDIHRHFAGKIYDYNDLKAYWKNECSFKATIWFMNVEALVNIF